MTNSLMQLLSDTSIIKVRIGIRNDVRELERVYGIGTCRHGASYLDLSKLVGLRWPNIRRVGLRNIVPLGIPIREIGVPGRQTATD